MVRKVTFTNEENMDVTIALKEYEELSKEHLNLLHSSYYLIYPATISPDMGSDESIINYLKPLAPQNISKTRQLFHLNALANLPNNLLFRGLICSLGNFRNIEVKDDTEHFSILMNHYLDLMVEGISNPFKYE